MVKKNPILEKSENANRNLGLLNSRTICYTMNPGKIINLSGLQFLQLKIYIKPFWWKVRSEKFLKY
jgi:hypothetical protein